MPAASVTFDRVVLGAAIVLTAVLFTSRLADPVNVVKMTALALCAIALLTSAAVRAVRTRVVTLPWGAGAAAGLALLAAFLVTAAATPVTSTAVLGAQGRNSGLLTYACALVLFLVGLRVLDPAGTRTVLYALMLAGGFTAGYGLLQYVGIDPVAWNNPFNPIIAALGNPNFAAAYLAICTAAAAWGALRTGWSPARRAASGVLALLCLVTALLTDSAQGPLAAAPGLGVLALAWLLDRPSPQRGKGLAALAAGGALAAVALAAGAAGVGPAARIFSDGGSRARGLYWEAALSMWRDHPVLGVGLETFGAFWRTDRPLEAVRTYGAGQFTDAAHSVPLHLLATGGLVLALAYAAFVLLTATALVQGLRRLAGEERLRLGAVGGCWVAYQVQSLVSIDQVPLIVTQYVLAAAVFVAASWSPLREMRLRGAVPVRAPQQPTGKRRRKAPPPAPRARRLGRADAAALSVVGVLALAATWQALVPLRASAAVLSGDRAAVSGDAPGAAAAYARATELVPGNAQYWRRKAQFHLTSGQAPQGLAALREAVLADPLDPEAARQAAKAAEEQGELEEARRLHVRAVELDPWNPRAIVGAATFELRHEGAARARSLLEGKVDQLPTEAELWATLGDARAVLDEPDAARAAYTRALELAPGNEVATAGLAKLDQPE